MKKKNEKRIDDMYSFQNLSLPCILKDTSQTLNV